MKKIYSYHDCYRVLGTKPDSDWADLRKAYKKSIQKWHPDRFKDDTPEKLAAEDKIKAISIAYKQIHAYYRQNGNMPAVEEVTKAVPKETAKKSSVHSKPSPSSAQKKPNTTSKPTLKVSDRKAPIRLASVFMLASIFPIYYILIGTYDFDQQYESDYKADEIDLQDIQTSTETNEKDITTSYLHDEPLRKGTYNEQQTLDKVSKRDHASIQDNYFTYGSTFADVIGTQGAPTKTDGNIWFYGNSEVHFEEGKVSHWVRTTQNPLKAQMTIDR